MVQQQPELAPSAPWPGPIAAPTNVLAVISLVAGVSGFVLAPLVGGVIAIATGHVARGAIRRTGEAGDGMALAGLILGYLNVALAVVAFMAFVALLAFFGLLFVIGEAEQPGSLQG